MPMANFVTPSIIVKLTPLNKACGCPSASPAVAGFYHHAQPGATLGGASSGAAPLALVIGLGVGGRVSIANRRKRSRQRPSVVVRLASTRETREAIRKCLRENKIATVFQELPEPALQQLLDAMVRIEVNPGVQLFEQGEHVENMYVVETGDLAVCRRLSEDDGKEFQAAILGPGSYIGELGLFQRRLCAETVRVHGDSPAVLWRLNREDFYGVIRGLAKPEEVPVIDGSSPDIFVVSDNSGASGSGAVRLALKQFGDHWRSKHADVNVTMFPYIRYEAEVVEITRRAREQRALVVYTLLRDEPRKVMTAEVQRPLNPGENKLRAVDLWEPMLVEMEDLLGVPRQSKMSVNAMRPSMSDSCLKMVEAIEFTRKLDDGVHPKLWKDADILLIGLSRAGKTPLSVFLSQRGFKVANYPVVPDEEPPKELFDQNIQHKCIALTINAERLQARRSERMSSFGGSKSTYSSLQNCIKEVNWLKTFYIRKGPQWPVIDTTNGGVEEMAAKIIKHLARQRGVSEKSEQFSNPSVA